MMWSTPAAGCLMQELGLLGGSLTANRCRQVLYSCQVLAVNNAGVHVRQLAVNLEAQDTAAS